MTDTFSPGRGDFAVLLDDTTLQWDIVEVKHRCTFRKFQATPWRHPHYDADNRAVFEVKEDFYDGTDKTWRLVLFDEDVRMVLRDREEALRIADVLHAGYEEFYRVTAPARAKFLVTIKLLTS